MIELRKLEPKDLLELSKRSGSTYIGAELSEPQVNALAASPYAFAIDVDGECLMVAGVTEYWAGRAESWAILDPKCKRRFVELHNVVKRFLDVCPVRRIEAAVECDFVAGHRWVRALGFELEAPRLRAFLPDGKDATMYARVKHV